MHTPVVGFLASLLKIQALNALKALPWLLGSVAAGGALLAACSMTPSSLAALDGFFGAAAQVLAALLVAVPLSAIVTDPAQPLGRALAVGMMLPMVGLLASLGGLLPGLCEGQLRAALALTIGGVVAGVATLLLVLVQAIATPVSDEAWLQRLRDSGALVQAEEPVDAATAELIRQSLMGNVLTRWRARRELSRRLMG